MDAEGNLQPEAEKTIQVFRIPSTGCISYRDCPPFYWFNDPNPM
jgi:hypothetical protein